MPENKPQIPQPRNLLELINLNVYLVSQDLHKLMDDNAEMRREIAELRAMFNAPAPELPNAVPGSDGAVTQQ